MSYYGGTVTVAGRNLITSLMAGKTIEFTESDQSGSGYAPVKDKLVCVGS